MLDGRLYFSNHCSKMLEKLGDMQINKVVVFKKPIMGTLFNIMEKIRDKKEVDNKRVFHVGMILTLNNDVQIVLEKNEEVTINYLYGLPNETEYRNVENFQVMSLSQMLYLTERRIGKQHFYHYDLSHENCQDFTFQCLKTMGITDQSVYKWFMHQNLPELVSKYKGFFNFTQGITNAKRTINKFFGTGIEDT